MKRIREPFGKAGLIVAVVALVAAMVGGAYAADSASTSGKRHHKKAHHKKKKKSKYVITNKKQIKPNVLKQLKGNAGAAGPAGPQGPKGDNGSNGSDGAKGDKGEKGDKGNTGDTGPQGPPGKDGKDGETGFTETLPTGETEHGVWGVAIISSSGGVAVSPLNFAIPLAAPLEEEEVHYLDKSLGEKLEAEEFGEGAGELCEGETGAELTECEAEYEALAEACPGNSANPEAAEGNLCVYTGFEFGEASVEINTDGIPTGASTSGAVMLQSATSFRQGRGTWAVTAP